MAIDDRPRKKKKQEKSNTVLWIALGVGGAVVLLIVLVLGGVLAMNAMASREADEKAMAKLQAALAAVQKPPEPPPAKPAKPNFDKADIGDKPRPTNNIRLRAERPGRLNELRQIGLFYQTYRSEFNKPPQTVQEFAEYIKRDAPAIKQAIEEKYYVVLPRVMANQGIVAYEFDPDTASRHGVVDSTGAAQEITTAELVELINGKGN